MAIPKFHEFFYPLLKLLESSDATTSQCYDYTFSFFKLTEEDKSAAYKISGNAIAPNRMLWGIAHLKGAELITSPKRGVYSLTEKGKKLISENSNGLNKQIVKDIIKDNNNDSQTSKDSQRSVESSTANETFIPIAKDPIEAINDASREIDGFLAMQVLDELYKADPFYFEKIVVDLLIKMGYGYDKEGFKRGETTTKSNDFGIDGVIYRDRLKFDKIYIQAKRYQKGNNIGRPEIQQFAGAISQQGASKGIFITTSDYGNTAIAAIKDMKHFDIISVNGKELANLMVEYNIGVTTEKIISIKKLDIDYFDEV